MIMIKGMPLNLCNDNNEKDIRLQLKIGKPIRSFLVLVVLALVLLA